MGSTTFLVVDDSVTMRRVIINTLKKIGYGDFHEAENGKDALGKLYSESIDVIITDWNMPVMSGLEFVQTVKADAAYAKIPILMVTTRSEKDDIVAALKTGINNYVVKPFTPEVLRSKIETIQAGR